MSKILVVEDDLNTLSGLIEILTDEGYTVSGAESGEKALKIMDHEQFNILLTDYKLPDMNGLELHEKSLPLRQSSLTIIMTAYSSIKDAVEAMKKGVYHYLTKPLNLDELFLLLKKALKEQELHSENVELKEQIKSSYRFENMIGNSEKMKNIYRVISKVARSQSTILIRGESGVGKELVARAIHYNSLRSEGQLVEISCASLPETLLESELFGYEKGAFTGANNTKKGRFEIAHNGTIFLDEIGEIPESIQTKLLRVLQSREINHLGSTEVIKVDVRVIAATNRDLEKAVSHGRFREDLYYRLNVIPVFIPPLRERKDDIPLLIEHFMKKFTSENNKQYLKFSDQSMDHCMRYDWPGNVRELENAIENAVVLAEGDTIMPEDLPLTIFADVTIDVTKGFLDSDDPFKKKIERAERAILKNAIDQANGNKSKAAKQLKISLRTMRYKIKKYNL
ncbi:MAG: sigma-54 dependent transcriptional regulator [candidate division KSB1 bacterium]|jgi:DNA-binding NtrC family response regulator|nr:sigma-54 dependent transcriptional regulator [candidate division KSB1 bacterium]